MGAAASKRSDSKNFPSYDKYLKELVGIKEDDWRATAFISSIIFDLAIETSKNHEDFALKNQSNDSQVDKFLKIHETLIKVIEKAKSDNNSKQAVSVKTLKDSITAYENSVKLLVANSVTGGKLKKKSVRGKGKPRAQSKPKPKPNPKSKG